MCCGVGCGCEQHALSRFHKPPASGMVVLTQSVHASETGSWASKGGLKGIKGGFDEHQRGFG
eukprot:2320549-Rhodomonas_salina.1